MNVASQLLETMDRLGTRPAIFGRRGRSVSFERLAEAARDAARKADGAGVGAGDRVLVEIPPGPGLVSWATGVLSVGAVPSFIEPGHGDAVYHRQVHDLAPVRRVSGSMVQLIRAVPGVRQAMARRGIPVPPGTPIRAIGSRGRDAAVPVEVEPGAPALSITTGGTTAQPTHVIHSHDSVSSMLDRIAGLAGDAGDVGVDTAPQILAGVALGFTSHVIGGIGRRRARRLGTLVSAGSIDSYFGAPSTWSLLLEDGLRSVSRRFRHVILGGAPVTRTFLRSLLDALGDGVRVTVVYGLTEHGPVTAIDARAKLAFAGAGDLVGPVLGGIDLTIDGNEVVVNGIPTGDEGALVDFEGAQMLVLYGRSKNMIIRGGVNLYPELLEPIVLDRLADSVQVREVALIGVPDTGTGDEEIVCWYAPDADGANVRRIVEGVLGTKARPDRYVGRERLPRIGRQQKLDRGRMRVESS